MQHVPRQQHLDGRGSAMTEYRVHNRVGENPVWDAGSGRLLWIDVRRQQLLSIDPQCDEPTVQHWQLDEPVGAMALCTDGRVLLALRRRLVLLDRRDGSLQPVAEVDTEPPGNRLNDGKVSPGGGWFVFGSMNDGSHKLPTGSLHVLGADGRVRRLRGGLCVANGIAFSPDGLQVYFSDSHAGQVWVAPWDEARGDMGAPRHFVFSGEAQGRPDGAVVNRRGDYLSAGVSAGRLNRFSADGLRLPALHLPCRAPTMCCYGGPSLEWWFVTSLVRPEWTEGPPEANEQHAGSCDGSLFRLVSDGLGLPAASFRFL